MFRNHPFQRTIATLLITTLCYGIGAPIIANAQTSTPATAPNIGSLVPLQAPGNYNNNTNNVLLPVGPHSLPGQGGASSTGIDSNPAAAYAAALASLHDFALQANQPGSTANAASQTASIKAIQTQYQSVLAQQKQMASAFAATQSYLTQQGVPAAILQRQQAAAAAFTARAAQLQTAMNAIGAANGSSAPSALKQLQQFFQQYPSESGQTPAPATLPWGNKKGLSHNKQAAQRAPIPAHTAREFERLFPRSIQVASAGGLSGIVLPNPVLGSAPTAADLAATDDVQITPAITALASSLQNNPVALYEYVRNNVQYQVGYGSLQGAALTLQALRGNDIDSASLLIALYRAAGIPSRYAYGTIQVPIARLQNWLNVDNAAAAQTLLNAAGIPNQAIATGGQTSAIQLEHVWVEAYVDNSPSGGAINKNPSTWVPVDPSFKQEQTQTGLNLNGAASLNQAGLFNSAAQGAVCTANSGQSLNQANIQSGFAAYQAQLTQIINGQGANLTVGGVLGSTSIAPENYSILLGSLPYQTIAVGATFDAVPANLQGALHLRLYADATAQANGSAAIAYSASYADLAGHRLTLSFTPATAADAAVLAAYMPKAHADGSAIQASEFPASIPGYLIEVTANLMLDGQVVSTGGNFVLGSELIGVIGNYDPAAGAWNDNGFTPHAGDYHAIVSDPQGINAAQLAAAQARLAATQARVLAASSICTPSVIMNGQGYCNDICKLSPIKPVTFPQECSQKSIWFAWTAAVIRR